MNIFSRTTLQVGLVLFLITGLLGIKPVIAQGKITPGDLVLIQTIDDNEYYGTITEKTNGYYRIESEVLGIVQIPFSAIKKINEIAPDRIKGNEYWSENPQSTRYFWAPNGYGLKKGEGYYQNVWVFFNQMSVGVVDNFSIGAGLVPTFLFGAEVTPVWVTPKVSIPVSSEKNNVNLGIGALLGTFVGVKGSNYGVLYGVATIGSQDTNMNLGAGWGYAENDIAEKPTLTFSAMIRTGKRGYFITENYLMDWGGDNGFGIVSFGGRTVGKRLSFDYGLMVPIENGDVHVAIPWIGVAVPMGN
ncbi:MAG: hypothetical protein KTR29_01540 [Rhodothermaceae bacterium]|nr:hypothetical protein [Rhodothermaceae bacterium]